METKREPETVLEGRRKHTPLPWRVVGREIWAGDRMIARACNSLLDEFIVRACNAHDDLLAALEWALPRVDTQHLHRSALSAYQAARAAIAKAQGG
jgi:hypothetical protein